MPRRGAIHRARVIGGSGARRLNLPMTVVDPGYFPTLRIPIVAGRAFTDTDGPASRTCWL